MDQSDCSISLKHGINIFISFFLSLFIYYNYIGSSHERMAKETERFSAFKQQRLVEEKK